MVGIMKHYLIAWGTSFHEIRHGEGNPIKAAKEAFGTADKHDLRRMTWKEVSITVMRSDLLRTRACYELLTAHRDRAFNKNDSDAAQLQMLLALQKQKDEIANRWTAEWDRYAKRYGRSRLLTGPEPFYFDDSIANAWRPVNA
jgi:hypothetical protein